MGVILGLSGAKIGLRAVVTTGHGIAFGYIMAISLMLFTSLKIAMRNGTAWWVGAAFMALGLLVGLSRGPWMGAAGALMFYLFFSANRAQDYTKFAGVAI
eukprot:gene12721-17060_t